MKRKVQLIRIERLVAEMNVIIHYCSEKIARDLLFEDEVISSINSLVDAVVHINNNLNQIFTVEILTEAEQSLNRVAKLFEEIIIGYQQHNKKKIKSIFLQGLVKEFVYFYELLNKNNLMVTKTQKIVIAGTNNLSFQVERLLDSTKTEILAYVSNDSDMVGKKVNGIPVFYMDELTSIHYDCLILTDHFSGLPNKNPVMNLTGFINHCYDFELYRAYSTLQEAENVEGFITGLSYAEVGLDTNLIQGNFINVAVSSQDLFYDYEWAQLIVEQHANTLKYGIIGLSLYSFHYDLSRSSLKHRIHQYYPLFNKTHNYQIEKNVESIIKEFEKLAKILFTQDYKTIIYNILKNHGLSWWIPYVNQTMGSEQIYQGSGIAKKDMSKNYPETVVENIDIIRGIISLLQSKGIQPIIVIFPVSKYYYEHFSEDMEQETLQLLAGLNQDYNVEVLNFFKSPLFKDDDFYDASHLNTKGASKLTEVLNKRVFQTKQETKSAKSQLLGN